MPGNQCNGFANRTTAILKESKAFCEGAISRQRDEAMTVNPHIGGNAEDSWDVGWFLIDQLAGDTVNQFACCGGIGLVPGVAGDIIPRWDDAIPSVEQPQGATWDIDLNNYIAIGVPDSFAIDTGGLPTGITLNTATGTFTGTITNLAGQGQVTFTATNTAGTSNTSPTMKWVITT